MKQKTTHNLVSRKKMISSRLLSITGLFVLVFCSAYNVYEESGVEKINGIVNSYAKVIAVGNNYLDLSDASAFKAGDRVLIIQMKGAIIQTANDSTFGDVTSWGNSGNYEFGKIVSKEGNRLVFVHKICKTYDPSHAVQVVRVPVYKKVDIVGTLTAQPWDGEKGGIVAIWATGRVKLLAGIDVSSLGFRGGQFNGRARGGEMTYTCTIESGKGGRKGEGIVETPNTGCIGKQATGGGGGNNHNGGGGGGGNFGTGGIGGHGWLSNRPGRLSDLNKGGRGGLSLAELYNEGITKLFLGGGGGGGHQNNGASYRGGNGGGIAIIKAEKLIVDTQVTINAAGEDAQDIRVNDGASGGGAGGTIFLDVNEIDAPEKLTLRIDGGDGADVITRDQHGPGGGGGGGIINSPRTIDPKVTIAKQGGNSGIFISSGRSPSNPHHGTPHGATAGHEGGVLDNLVIQECSAKPIIDLNGAHPGTDRTISYDIQGTTSDTQDSSLFEIDDNDNVYLEGAEIELLNPGDGNLEYLKLGLDETAMSQMAITAEFDSSHHKLILSGSSLVENYQQTLSQLQYRNDEKIPDPSDRLIEITVDDGGAKSEPAFTTVTLTTNPFLPVEWLSFEAEPILGATQLRWATASEQNTDYFDIERSVDGTIFTSLGRTRAAGNSQIIQNYQFVDETLGNMQGQTLYYRLKQVDLNGMNGYSQVIKFSPTTQLFDLTFSVNVEESDLLTVKTSRGLKVTGKLDVLTLDGKIMTTHTIPTNQREVQIQTDGWSPGTYIFSMTEDLKQVSKKVQIQ
ncbi:MAG: hypothetical protein AAF135_18950 [Bacteroidota bacterium]